MLNKHGYDCLSENLEPSTIGTDTRELISNSKL